MSTIAFQSRQLYVDTFYTSTTMLRALHTFHSPIFCPTTAKLQVTTDLKLYRLPSYIFVAMQADFGFVDVPSICVFTSVFAIIAIIPRYPWVFLCYKKRPPVNIITWLFRVLASSNQFISVI